MRVSIEASNAMNRSIFRSHLNKLRSYFEGHRQYFKPELLAFSAFILVAVFIYICFSVYLHPGGERFCYHFTSEEGAITILSATNLSMSALLAYTCFFIKPVLSKREKIFFLIIALALTYLALDEVMHFHENVGDYLDTFRNLRKINHRVHVRAWNDTIIIIYGILAVPVALYFLPTAAQIPCIPEYFSAAFLCYIIHTSIDSFVDPPTTFSHIVEESFKVYTSTFLVLGLLSGLLFLLNRNLRRT